MKPAVVIADSGALANFLGYIIKNNLRDIIGLQILGCSNHSMSELILEQANVMLDSSHVKSSRTQPLGRGPVLQVSDSSRSTGASRFAR